MIAAILVLVVAIAGLIGQSQLAATDAGADFTFLQLESSEFLTEPLLWAKLEQPVSDNQALYVAKALVAARDKSAPVSFLNNCSADQLLSFRTIRQSECAYELLAARLSSCNQCVTPAAGYLTANVNYYCNGLERSGRNWCQNRGYLD